MPASESLKWILDVDNKGAVKGFEQIGSTAEKELGKAESKLDKLGGSLTKFGAGAMAFAGVAGAGLIKLGTDASNHAVEMGKASDATGLSVEQFSRLNEVAGDLGVETSVLEKSLGFMNKTLGGSPEKFKELGVEVVRAKDGTVDANATFLAVVDRLNAITDPAKRAEAGAKLLGRGWQEMAELIAAGSGSLTTSMAAVSDQKVITPEELAKARDFRAAMDQMKDAGQDLALSLGQGVAPMIATVAKGVGTVVDAFGKLDAVTSGAAGTFLGIGTAVIGAAGALSFITGKVIMARERFSGLFSKIDGDGVKSLTGLGKAAGPLAGVLGAATLAFVAWQDALKNDAAAAAAALVEIEGFARATSLDEMRESFKQWSWEIIIQGKAVENNFDDLAKANLIAAKALADSGIVAQENAGWQKQLEAAILAEEAAQKKAAETTAKYTEETAASTTATDTARSAVLKAKDGQRDYERGLRETNAAYDDLGKVTGSQIDAEARHFQSLQGVNAQYDHLGVKVKSAVDATNEMIAKYDALTGRFDQRQAWLNVNQALDEFKWKMNSGELSTQEQEQAIIDVSRELATYVQNVKNVPDEKKTEILALIEHGKIAEAETEIAKLTRPRTVTLGFAMPVVPKFHDGGVVGGSGPVGSEQLILAKKGETILPTHKGGGAAAAGASPSPPTAGGGFTAPIIIQLGATLGEVEAWMTKRDRDRLQRARAGVL